MISINKSIIKFLILLLVVMSITTPSILAIQAPTLDPRLFPRSNMIDIQVYFWKRIFIEVPSTEGLLHDDELILPIYEKLDLIGLTSKQAKRKLKKRKAFVREQLLILAKKLEQKQLQSIGMRKAAPPDHAPLNQYQSALLKKFYVGITPHDLRKAAHRIRFQYGIADHFRSGLIRSGAYMDHIQKTFKQHNLPIVLGYLPHVESSFHVRSQSKTGARGIWQFTRLTGKQYMRVNSRVDERLDPFASTKAAAKLLKFNYKKLKSWPLAITAYNHGANGIDRITKKLRNRDLGYLIRHYKSRRFNFASKNFYAEFIAAAEVAANYKRHFGNLKLNSPITYKKVRLPQTLSLNQIISRLGYPRQQIIALNPALKRSVIRGKHWVPSYYRVKIPSVSPRAFSISEEHKINKSLPTLSKWVTVRRGDTLSDIALRFKTSTRRLTSLNNLTLRSRIYPGQVLRIHWSVPQHPRITTQLGFSGRLLHSNGPTPNKLPTHNSNYVFVRGGDSLYAIARRNDVSIKELIEINSLRNSKIFPGQRLELPRTLEIGGPFKDDVLRTDSNIIVKKGDTLASIARKNGVKLRLLIAINGLKRTSIIYPGQRLIIQL